MSRVCGYRWKDDRNSIDHVRHVCVVMLEYRGQDHEHTCGCEDG